MLCNFDDMDPHLLTFLVLASLVIGLAILGRLAGLRSITAVAFAVMPVLFLWLYVNTPMGGLLQALF
jgi:uncharacterized MAPEG superfamily protein